MVAYAFFRCRLISIHAPARGATTSSSNTMIIIFNFNPRSREGSDERLNITDVDFEQFQSTLPRGERPFAPAQFRQKEHFNPRSREGSDEKGCKNNRHRETFQSTLPRGERRNINVVFFTGFCISIHAPARGATLPA